MTRQNNGSVMEEVIERGVRSKRALKLAIAEMYLKGVSTRKVTAIVGELCGFDITSTQVSRATQELDAELELWRSRPLGTTPFVQLDASYEKSMDPFDPVRYSSPAASQPMAIERFSVSVSP